MQGCVRRSRYAFKVRLLLSSRDGFFKTGKTVLIFHTVKILNACLTRGYESAILWRVERNVETICRLTQGRPLVSSNFTLVLRACVNAHIPRLNLHKERRRGGIDHMLGPVSTQQQSVSYQRWCVELLVLLTQLLLNGMS